MLPGRPACECRVETVNWHRFEAFCVCFLTGPQQWHPAFFEIGQMGPAASALAGIGMQTHRTLASAAVLAINEIVSRSAVTKRSGRNGICPYYRMFG